MQQRELTTKPIAFFGDIHGHWDFVKQIPEVLDDHYWVFVGDYMDSFTQHPKYQIACLTQIRDWVDMGLAEAIPGNHDLQYVWRQYRCSGFKPDTQSRMLVHRDTVLAMPHSLLIDNVLVTHAGLTRPLHDKLIQKYPGEPLDQILEIEGNRQDSIVHECGISRGGAAAWGGIYWCDWTAEFDPVPGLHQVFGHSHSPTPPRLFTEETDGNLRFVRFCDSRSYNIDCLSRKGVFDVLTYDNYKFGRIRLKYDSNGKLERASGKGYNKGMSEHRVRPVPEKCDYCHSPLPEKHEYIDNRKYDQEWYFCDKDCMISEAIEKHPIGAHRGPRTPAKRRDPERM